MKKIPFEYKITFAYIVLGALWIMFSDELVVGFTKDPYRIQTLSTYKGWFYVLITGILLFMLVKREIKRRNKLYNQVLEAKKHADEADRLKTAFLTNLSHYIRTPMNSILGFIDLLENKNNSPEKNEQFLKFINDRSNHLLQTLNSIIEISKIQEGHYKVNISQFSVNELISELLISASVELKQKDKNVDLMCSEGQINGMDELYTDREIVFHILSKLLSNSINFTEKGEIFISYIRNQEQYIFKVKDTGPGVPAEKQKALFNEFMFNDTYTYAMGEGAGIGLHLASRLAQLIGGRLWLESSGSTGSVFCLGIPVK